MPYMKCVMRIYVIHLWQNRSILNFLLRLSFEWALLLGEYIEIASSWFFSLVVYLLAGFYTHFYFLQLAFY